jgi:hypothetical protein
MFNENPRPLFIGDRSISKLHYRLTITNFIPNCCISAILVVELTGNAMGYIIV